MYITFEDEAALVARCPADQAGDDEAGAGAAAVEGFLRGGDEARGDVKVRGGGEEVVKVGAGEVKVGADEVR